MTFVSPTVDASEPCRELEWDSLFFDLKIATVIGTRLDQDKVLRTLEWARSHSIDCLYFLADPLGPTLRLAEQHCFQLMDVRVTLVCELPVSMAIAPPASTALVRPAVAADVPALCEIAAVSHTDSRFYADQRFPRDRCDALYRTWIEKSCHGFADAVFVVQHQEQPVGYVTCHIRQEGTGNIGLLGIAACCRNSGFGSILLANALRWFSSQGIKTLTVVTQGKNIASQRLYQRNSFVTQSLNFWYHLWPRHSEMKYATV